MKEKGEGKESEVHTYIIEILEPIHAACVTRSGLNHKVAKKR
jgi:hypothetical protein